ncbi:hypothetical protein ACIBQ6_19550 [Nonomuraea sp. NPDC049655]|uniref:hypothetical protein n=1 Tax=Nonomuraea sp. NPDC049655 TaxID=3364355 RepID=UPI0037B84274
MVEKQATVAAIRSCRRIRRTGSTMWHDFGSPLARRQVLAIRAIPDRNHDPL